MANEYAFLDNNHHPTLLGVSPTGEIRRLIVGDDGAVWTHAAPPAIVLYNLSVGLTAQTLSPVGGGRHLVVDNRDAVNAILVKFNGLPAYKTIEALDTWTIETAFVSVSFEGVVAGPVAVEIGIGT